MLVSHGVPLNLKRKSRTLNGGLHFGVPHRYISLSNVRRKVITIVDELLHTVEKRRF